MSCIVGNAHDLLKVPKIVEKLKSKQSVESEHITISPYKRKLETALGKKGKEPIKQNVSKINGSKMKIVSLNNKRIGGIDLYIQINDWRSLEKEIFPSKVY